MNQLPFEPLQLTKKEQQQFGRINTLKQIQNIDPVVFERLCGWLYETEGYTVSITPKTGDQGVDLFLEKKGERIVVQCKRYADTVGQPVVRDLYGTMMHQQGTGAVLVTSGTFSQQATDWSQDKPIRLIDGVSLLNWINYVNSANQASEKNSFNWSRLGVAGVILLCLILCLASGLMFYRTYQTVFFGQSPTKTAEPTVNTVVMTETTTTPSSTATLKTTPAATITATPTLTVSTQAEIFTVPKGRVDFTADLTEWGTIASTPSNKQIAQFESWDQTDDLTATWRFLYDENFLYGYVLVEDDKIVQDNTDPLYLYYGDSIELHIDTSNDGAETAQTDDFQYLFSPGNFQGNKASLFRYRGDGQQMAIEWGTKAEVVSFPTPTGYTISFRIPWYDVKLPRNPAPETEFGLSLVVNDKDTDIPEQQEVVYSNVATHKWSRPSTWGKMMLGE